MMMRVLQHLCGPYVEHFTYRVIAPIKVWSEITVCARLPEAVEGSSDPRVDVWVEGPDGSMAVRGRATLEPQKVS